MLKNMKLKTKLLASFFLITCISTIATTGFAIYYFSNAIYREALTNLEKSRQVADLTYQQKVKDVQSLGLALAQDRGLQVLVQFKINHSLREHLNNYLSTNPLQQVLVSDAEGELLVQVRQDGLSPPQELSSNPLIKAALDSGEAVSGIEIVKQGGTVQELLSISAAVPIMRNRAVRPQTTDTDNTPQLIGVVLVRYILNDDSVLVGDMSNLLGVSAAFYLHEKLVSGKSFSDQHVPQMPNYIYPKLIKGNQDHYLQSELTSGAHLATYQLLRDNQDKPVGVLSISVPADKYLATTREAMLTLLGIMLLCIIGASLLAYWLARSILIPVNQLLDGVKRVTSGDLSHEIAMDLRDELGTLAISFNSMSRQLKDLFSTLEQRVENATRKLQNTLAHLAAIIDNMADALLVTDTEGKIIRINPALASMYPEQQNHLLEHSISQLGPELQQLVQQAGHSQQTYRIEVNLSQGRIGQAVATAIMHKDSFAEDEHAKYIGSKYLGTVILIRDITREKEIDRMLKNTVDTLTRVGNALSAEKNINKLLEMLVTEARSVSQADGGTLYTLKREQLHFQIVQNDSMNLFMGGTTNNPISLPPISLQEQQKISVYCATHKQAVRTPDIYSCTEFDFSAAKQYDAETGYRTHAMLAVPLLDRQNEAVGVLQLINPQKNNNNEESAHFSNNQVEIISALASLTAVAIENARNYEKIERKNAAFKRFVPTEFLNHLGRKEVEEITLGDASQENMSVLFSDIRSFTSLSETMSAEDNFHFLNDYLDSIGPNIAGNGGFIDKYIGDAIMALFASQQENTDNAVRAGVGMLQKLDEFNAWRLKKALAPIKIGIGIHTGPLTLGIIGFEDRMESTVIGDTVNLASRMEGLTKHYGIELGITESTYRQLSQCKDFLVREIDRVQVKGKAQAVTIYQVFDPSPAPLRERLAASLPRYREALLLYQNRSWQEAAQIFAELHQTLPEDRPIAIYQQRCQQWLQNPPPADDKNWIVTRLTEK